MRWADTKKGDWKPAETYFPRLPILGLCCFSQSLQLTSWSFRSSNLFLANESDSPCQSQKLQNTNAVPVEIDFIPGEPVSRGARMGMVIVVPAFTE